YSGSKKCGRQEKFEIHPIVGGSLHSFVHAFEKSAHGMSEKAGAGKLDVFGRQHGLEQISCYRLNAGPEVGENLRVLFVMDSDRARALVDIDSFYAGNFLD